MALDFPKFEMDEVALLASAVQETLERLKYANEREAVMTRSLSTMAAATAVIGA
jgi:hypothetical protein